MLNKVQNKFEKIGSLGKSNKIIITYFKRLDNVFLIISMFLVEIL